MKTIMAILLTIGLCTSGGYAQNKDMPGPATMGSGGFHVGYGNFDVSDLQSFLQTDFRRLSDQHLILGGHGHGMRGKFVIGGSGSGIIGKSITGNSMKVSAGGGYGTFDVGYLIVNKQSLKIYPVIGFGGGGFSVNISRNEDVSMDDIRDNPAREINISKGGFIFNLSVNLNFIPELKYDAEENSYGGFMTGLRVGYLYQPASSDWQFAGGDVTNAPDFGLNGPYVTMVIGGFGYRGR